MVVEPILALLGLFVQTPVPAGTTNWPTGMGNSRISEQSAYVRRLSNLLDRPAGGSGEISDQPASSVPSATGLTHVNSITGAGHRLSPEQLAQLNAEGKHIFDACAQAKALAAKGDSPGARARLEALLQVYPEPMPACTLMDIEILEGDYIDAYKVAAPFMRRGTGSVELMARASLVAAKLGEVYPGQHEFCRQAIGYGEWTAYLPDVDSPEVVAELSDIVIAQGFSWDHAAWFPFLEDAHKTDPQNPWICRMLSECYVFCNYDYSRAIKLLETALKGVPPSGILHDDVLNALDEARADFRKVGDGKPARPVVAQASLTPAGTIHP